MDKSKSHWAACLWRTIKTVGSAHTRQGDDPPGPPHVNNNDACHNGCSLAVRWIASLLFFAYASVGTADNRLIHATSLYLQQHAHNPVDWYPWGTEALTRAQREKKLIFLSIGYAACHWCHVMERESFSNPETAAMLNTHYISIKVDREERPDLDGHFMKLLTVLTGSGGWPLNIILTPTLQPVYGGTYFPPQAAHGKPGFKAMLAFIQNEWQKDRIQLLERSKKFDDLLKVQSTFSSVQSSKKAPDPRLSAIRFWRPHFDMIYGGIGRKSKFPQPAIHALFLRQAASQKKRQHAEPTLLTLDHMASGGVRDQLGGAFHRYATDRRWQIPHFEIMLYDNALLARLYLEAYQLTGQVQYALVVHEILKDLLNRFRAPGGCFISSLDADSDGREGAFYTWTDEEIIAVLGQEQAIPFMERLFDPIEGVIKGRTVLRLLNGLDTLTQDRMTWQESRKRLLAARAQRPAPMKNDTLLTSWNGLAITAFARAGAVLQEASYLTAAQACLDNIQKQAYTAGQLRHSRRGGVVGTEVFLEDYAFLLQATLDLYEALFDPHFLDQAQTLAHTLLDRFQSVSGQPFQWTPKDQPSEIPVQTVLVDGVMPAGNSVALIALHRLALLSSNPRFETEAEAIRQRLMGFLETEAATSPELLHAWDYRSEEATLLTIVGSRTDSATQALLREVRRHLIPGLIVILLEPHQKVDTNAWPALTKRPMLDHQPTAYLCRDRVCLQPVNRVKDLKKLLEKGSPQKETTLGGRFIASQNTD